MAPGSRGALSLEHQRQLLELANAQHVEWQRLLDQLSEKLFPIIQEEDVEAVTSPNRPKLKDVSPGRKLSNTTAVQPEPVYSDVLTAFPATNETGGKDSGHESSSVSEGTPMPLTLKSAEEVEESRNTKASMTTETPEPRNPVLRWIKHRLNYIAGTLVILNTLVMFLELEFEGQHAARTLGVAIPTPVEETYYRQLFRMFDGFFDVAFVLEMLLRICCDGTGWRFFCRPWNQVELLLVIVGVMDLFIILMFFEGGRADSFLLHVFRSAHALRALRTCRLFKGLRVLLRACEAFITSLFWAMVLLLIFMSAGSVLIGNLLQSFILSDAAMDDRTWIWEHYGTAYRCWYTLYELTFAGNWPTRARPVTDMVDPRFAIFFFTYITFVSFAMIRVVTAVFLKDTLEAAQNDQELQLLNQLKKKAEYVKKLEKVFKTIDDGNGIIKEERLLAVLADPQVMAHLQTLDLDVHEGTALFHLLDNGDGEVTLEEFIDGILRCKGPARAVDQVAMHAEIRQMDAKLAKVLRLLCAESRKEEGDAEINDKMLNPCDVSTHLRAFSELHSVSRKGSKGTGSGGLHLLDLRM